MIIKILKCGDYPVSSGWSNVVTGSLLRERWEIRETEGDMTVETERGLKMPC